MEAYWSKAEFKAYLLAYCAQSNFVETAEEKDFILDLVSSETYKNVLNELAKDNDYQSIQKIQHHLNKFNYSEKEIDTLIKDVKELFLADGSIDVMEDGLFRALKRVIQS